MILERSKIVRGESRLRFDFEDELDELDEVGPSPALLLEKPLPRARVRPTDTADKLGIGRDLGMPIAMESRFIILKTTWSLGLRTKETSKSKRFFGLFV